MKRKPDELPMFPLLETFGGLMGTLIVLLVISLLNLQSLRSVQVLPHQIKGIRNVNLSIVPQIKIYAYPDKAVLEDNILTIEIKELLEPENSLERYLTQYVQETNEKKKDIFIMLYPNSNKTMYAIRQTLARLGVKEFNMIILDKELIDQLINLKLDT